MPIISVSRCSYSHGTEVAERVARDLGYECIASEVTMEAANTFHVPRVKLEHALHDSPSLWDHLSSNKEKMIACIRTAFLEHMQRDNVVYQGLAGHFFLSGVSHALKVRLVADLEDRVNEEIKREQISRDEALKRIRKDDEARKCWSKDLFGFDNEDASQYDLVIHFGKLNVDDAVKLIINTVKLPRFQTTPESKEGLQDLLTASRVQNQLIGLFDTMRVTSRNGSVVVDVKAPLIQEAAIVQRIHELIGGVYDDKAVRVNVVPINYE